MNPLVCFSCTPFRGVRWRTFALVPSPVVRRSGMVGCAWHSVGQGFRTCFSSCSPVLASSSSTPPLEGWRSLAHYPPWTNADAPSNHVGERGVMATVLRQEEGRQLLEEIQREKREREMQKTDHAPSHETAAQGLGRMVSAPIASSNGWDAAMSTSWKTAQEASRSAALSNETISHHSSPPNPRLPHGSPVPTSSRRHGHRAFPYSGVQREVLSLYRAFLKSIKGLQDDETRENLRVHAREKFNEGAALPKRKIDVIEWRINYGKRKLEELDRLGKQSTFRFVT